MPRRFLRQRLPWIAIDETDLRAVGDPETVVFLPDGSLLGLYIRGLDVDVMLGIREDVHGEPVSCAVTNEVHIDTNLHSNPRRHDESDQA